MNIFFLAEDPELCAQYHCDKHCVKMILEYAQLLSTAHRVIDGTQLTGQKHWTMPVGYYTDKLYKATHENHPCAIWARENDKNYNWLLDLLEQLCREYTIRYGRVHKVQSSGLLSDLNQLPTYIKRSFAKTHDPVPQCVPEHCKVPGNPVLAYQNVYLDKGDIIYWNKPAPRPGWPHWYWSRKGMPA